MNDTEKFEKQLENLNLFPEANYFKLEAALRIAVEWFKSLTPLQRDNALREIAEALEGKPRQSESST